MGWGALTKSFIGIHHKLRFSDAWIGLVSSVALTEVCHLWLPIDWKVSLLFLIIGLATFIKSHLAHPLLTLKQLSRIKPVYFLIGFVVFLIAGSLAMASPEKNYDSGLYHFQSIRWLNEYPIVLGLGNLHGRLGFNQSYFSYLGLLNLFPFFNKGYAVGSLLMLLMSIATLFEARFKYMKGGWWLTLWIFIAFISVLKQVSSPSPDIAVILIESCLFIYLIKLYSRESHAKNTHAADVVMVFLLACLVVTVKISAAVFALMSVIFVLPALAKTFHQNKKIYLYSFLLGGFLVGVHLIRGVLTSGLALYPSTLGAMWNLDWTVPYDQVKEEAGWIYSWARSPGKTPNQVLGSWAWLPDWGARLLKEHWRYVYGCAILTGLSFISLLLKKRPREEKALFFLYIPTIVSLIFWFMTAPDWRFLGAIPQLYVALSGFILIRYLITTRIGNCVEKIPQHLTSTLFSVLILSLITIILLLKIKSTDLKNLPPLGWQAIPIVETKEHITSSGLKVFGPYQAINAGMLLCLARLLLIKILV